MHSGYVLNAMTGVLHTDPANEACNVDAMIHRKRFDQVHVARQMRDYRRDCKRCMTGQ